jgi:hypothetical protein
MASNLPPDVIDALIALGGALVGWFSRAILRRKR